MRTADGGINSESDFVDSLSAVEFLLDNFVSLEEALEFAGEFVVLLRDQVDVSREGIDLVLHAGRFFDQNRVVVFKNA